MAQKFAEVFFACGTLKKGLQADQGPSEAPGRDNCRFFTAAG
jgi:hypothetical protein